MQFPRKKIDSFVHKKSKIYFNRRYSNFETMRQKNIDSTAGTYHVLTVVNRSENLTNCGYQVNSGQGTILYAQRKITKSACKHTNKLCKLFSRGSKWRPQMK